MNRAVFFIVAVALACSLVSGDSARAQGKKKMKAPSQEEMMKRWQEVMTPGDPHKKLEQMVGTWDAETKMWMNGPNAEPSVSTGTMEMKMVLGGRYLLQDFTGTMMDSPFNGIGYMGYDNFKKKYFGSWIDNMSTGMSTMEGTMDKAGNTLTMWGKMDEPMTGEKNKPVKYVVTLIDNNKHVFEIYDVKSYGEKKPVMQITYTRK